jgi:hypothetical protein
MVVTKERLFPRWKVRYGDLGRDGAGPSTCGHGTSEEMLRVTELVVCVVRIAEVAVVERSESSMLSG